MSKLSSEQEGRILLYEGSLASLQEAKELALHKTGLRDHTLGARNIGDIIYDSKYNPPVTTAPTVDQELVKGDELISYGAESLEEMRISKKFRHFRERLAAIQINFPIEQTKIISQIVRVVSEEALPDIFRKFFTQESLEELFPSAEIDRPLWKKFLQKLKKMQDFILVPYRSQEAVKSIVQIQYNTDLNILSLVYGNGHFKENDLILGGKTNTIQKYLEERGISYVLLRPNSVRLILRYGLLKKFDQKKRYTSLDDVWRERL